MDITSYMLGRIKGSGGAGVSYVVVEELPTTGEEGTIYLVPKSTSGTNNYYDEYMYINENWEKIGDTEIDLSDYQHTMQYAVVPNATADNLGKIIQYTGTTTESYTNGHFYKCVSDGEQTPTYSWEEQEVQSSNDIETILFKITTSPTDDDKEKWTYIWNNLSNIQNMRVFGKQGDKILEATSIIKDPTVGYHRLFIYFNYINEGGDMTLYGSYVRPGKFILLKIGFESNGTYRSISIDERNSYKIESIDYLGRNNTTSYTPTGDYNPATKKYVDDKVATKQNIIQYSTIPTASESTVGKIIQYTGTTDSTYTNGYFYIGTTDGEDPATYSWEAISVQDSGSSSAPQYIEDNNGRKLYFLSYKSGENQNYFKSVLTEMLKDFINDSWYQSILIMVYSGVIYIFCNISRSGNQVTFKSAKSILGKYEQNNKYTVINVGNVKMTCYYNTQTYEVTTIGSIETDRDEASYLDCTKNYSSPFIPTNAGHPATKKYVDDIPTTYTGYDATKTQVLKNINGTLTWVDET